MKKLLFASLLFLLGAKAEAQVNDFYLKMINNFEQKQIIAEPTVDYNLPEDINGFTFIDLYKGGFFGQTDLTKKIVGNVNAKARTMHENEIHTKTGTGLNYDLIDNKKLYANVSLLPIWFNNKGIIDRKTIDFYAEYSPSDCFSVSAFGEIEQTKEKTNWTYGEIDAGLNVGNFRFSYTPAISNELGKTKYEHRASITYYLK